MGGHLNEQGFTIVEVVVTLIVTSLFLAFFFQLYLVGESQRVILATQSTASNVSYTNLRKITDRSTLPACDTNPSTTANSNNLTINPSAAGSNATNLISPEPTSGLNGSVTQTIRIFYPRGCGINMPVKVEAAVTYGSPQESSVHATYIK